MGPSPILVAPGLRTPARAGWRVGVATAVAVVTATPSLWLLGALGYLLRGGLVLLALGILVLPSPVMVRLMLGEYLGSAGFSNGFYVAVAIGGAIALALVLLTLALSAFVELAAFERFVASDEQVLLSGRSAEAPAGAQRWVLLGALFGVQLVALATIVLAAVPLAIVAFEATYSELLRPNLAGGALYDRVIAQLGGALFVLLVVIVLVEMVSAVASRRLLAQAFGLAGRPMAGDGRARRTIGPLDTLAAIGRAIVRPLLRPVSTLTTALLGWLAMIVLLAPAAWALPYVWQAARAEYLGGASLTGESLLGLVFVTALLVSVWLGGLALAGLASALRAGLWSSNELR